jgi:hypothetical protein
MYWHENSQQQSESVIPAEAGIQCLFSSASPFMRPHPGTKKPLDSRLKMSGMTGVNRGVPFSFLGVQAASLHEEFLCP